MSFTKYYSGERNQDKEEQKLLDAKIIAKALYRDGFKKNKIEAATYVFEEIFVWDSIWEHRKTADKEQRKRTNEIIDQIVNSIRDND